MGLTNVNENDHDFITSLPFTCRVLSLHKTFDIVQIERV